MHNKYEYVDKDFKYIDALSGVLKNKAQITDSDKLILFESVAVQKRLIELQENPIRIQTSADLLKIHKYLFQDVYDWAGNVRTVEISKSGHAFLGTNAFDTAFQCIDGLITEYEQIPASNVHAISEQLAKILDYVNYGHFFREGNGRTQREFVRTLALQKGYTLNLNPIDDASVYEHYMAGTINGDVQTLVELISDIITPN